MATEDHDFEEISSFIFQGKKFRWNTKSVGAVGKIKTQSLKPLLDLFKQELGSSINANALKALIKKSYETGGDLSHATRIFVNSLFEVFGLLIIDGDDKALKKHFVPYLKEELHLENSYIQAKSEFKFPVYKRYWIMAPYRLINELLRLIYKIILYIKIKIES